MKKSIIKNTCLILFFDVLTLNIPTVCKPKFSKCLIQTFKIFGTAGSSLIFMPTTKSAAELVDIVSNKPGTLPINRSRGSKLSHDPF